MIQKVVQLEEVEKILQDILFKGVVDMMTRKRFAETNWKMTYEQYQKCDCTECKKEDCIHRNAYRRVPEIDGGLGLCPNLRGE